MAEDKTLSYIDGLGWYWHTTAQPMAQAGGVTIYSYGQRLSAFYETEEEAQQAK